MANERLLDLIPESIRPQLIDEVKELINQQANATQTNKGIDPSFIAYARQQNEKAKSKKQ